MPLELVVTENDSADAYEAIRLYDFYNGLSRALNFKIKNKKPPRYFTDTMINILYDKSKKYKKDRDRVLENFISRFTKYLHIQYALATPLPRVCSLAFVAFPPQKTYPEFGAVITAGCYINHAFIPVQFKDGRVHAPRIAKFFHSVASTYFVNNVYGLKILEGAETRLTLRFPWIKNFLIRQTQKNLEDLKLQGREPNIVQAFRRAIRDLLRVFVGNVWLVWTYYAYQKGVIKHVELPYHLANDPSYVSQYINPIDCIYYDRLGELDPTELRDITWRWLLDTYYRR